MTLKTTQLRDAIRYAIAVGATAVVGTGAAYAQDTTGEQQEEATNLDRIQVTGSRIKRVELETSQPVFSLSREDIQAQGLTSVGDVIQNITANGSALNSTFNNGGNGETRVSLRNLGSNRTLVLVNGRRWVGGTGLGGAVDLNTIPTAAVERIEVLKDGASTIYGSDAIAGVVNVILRNEFDGAEANAFLGVFDKGDGFKQSYDFTIGSTGERFSALMSIGYVKEDPVWAGDREISAVPTFNTGLFFGSSTTPNGRFALCRESIDATSGRCLYSDGRDLDGDGATDAAPEVRPNGTTGQFTYNDGASGLNWRNRTGADVYNFAPDNYLITPQERKSVFGKASLDITDNVRFTAQTTYNNRRSEQFLAAMPIVLGSGPGAGTQARTISISADSIYNPFGAPVSRIQRRAIETGGRSFNQNVDTFAFSGVFEGSFELGDRFWTWDAGMVYGRNDQNDTTNGLFNVLALKNALGPSMIDANGNPICVSTPGNALTLIPGCVPLNLLGAVGSITPEMLAYSTFVAHDEFGYKMTQYFANISGELFDLPGGKAAIAFGIERRTEDGFSQPDALIASGNTTGNAASPTKGGYQVDEAYLEAVLPLLKDVPGASELELSFATRYSKYDTFGNTLNSKFGFKWRPIEDLLVRGNWAQGFRAPSILELYQGVADSFPQVTDPCNSDVFPQLTAEAQARCLAQGVAPGGYDQGNPQIRIDTGGYFGLQAEKSINRTLGLVWSPSFIEGFDVSLDWWRIVIEDAITTRSAQYILDQCVKRGDPRYCATPNFATGTNGFTRFPGGEINQLLAVAENTAQFDVEGYDLTVNYRMPETAVGKFSFSWDTTYLANFDQGDADGNLAGEYFDRSNNWRIRSNLLARWEMGDWGATWATRYFSRQYEDCSTMAYYGFGDLCSDPDRQIDNPETPIADLIDAPRNKIGGTTYHDVSVYLNTSWNAKVTLGINNVFDKHPPLAYSTFANTFDPQYELPGQFFYLQYNQKF
ncbi:MAG: TonB-dependent receptor [Pseudoxanthomonas suwonensis]|nr:MAG: TonB-dependent receptor [Pseudoxanthomonas suwonensis]